MRDLKVNVSQEQANHAEQVFTARGLTWEELAQTKGDIVTYELTEIEEDYMELLLEIEISSMTVIDRREY